MKYQIHGFQQKIAFELGLDDRDLLYLRWYKDFKDTDKMKCFIINGIPYYWVKYQAVIDDHPCLKVKNRTTIARSFNKMSAVNVLISYLKKDKSGTYTLFAVGPNYINLVDDGKKVESKGLALDKNVECKSFAQNKKVESKGLALDKNVDPNYPNTKESHPNTNTPGFTPGIDKSNYIKPYQKKYEPEILIIHDKIFQICNENRHHINPDNKFSDTICKCIKREGVKRSLLAVEKYWKRVNSGDKYAGSFHSIWYNPARLAELVNTKEKIGTFSELPESVKNAIGRIETRV